MLQSRKIREKARWQYSDGTQADGVNEPQLMASTKFTDMPKKKSSVKANSLWQSILFLIFHYTVQRSPNMSSPFVFTQSLFPGSSAEIANYPSIWTSYYHDSHCVVCFFCLTRFLHSKHPTKHSQSTVSNFYLLLHQFSRLQLFPLKWLLELYLFILTPRTDFTSYCVLPNVLIFNTIWSWNHSTENKYSILPSNHVTDYLQSDAD